MIFTTMTQCRDEDIEQAPSRAKHLSFMSYKYTEVLFLERRRMMPIVLIGF